MAQILVIDDEELVRLTIRQCLEAAGHSVSEAEDGMQGLRMLRDSLPDLVITDIIMPEKEGVETIMELRREHPEVPVIAISGGGRLGNKDFLASAQYLGAQRTLKKPFSPEDLNETVHEVLNGAAPDPDKG